MSTHWHRRFRFVRERIIGASLIEVLIAFAVLALGITSVVSFQGTLTQNSDHSKARTEAANYGEKKLEELRNFTSLAGFDAYASGSDTVTGTNHTYTRTWTVTTGTDYKTIALNVTWPDKSGVATTNTTVKLNTVIARVDPAVTILSVYTSTSTTSTTTTSNSTTSTTASGTTTTAAPTTSTTAASTTTTTATTTSTTSTSSSSTSTTTTSTTANTPTTTVVCRCARQGNSSNFDALDYVSDPANPYYSCTDSCCGNSPLKCLTNNCTFNAYCPL